MHNTARAHISCSWHQSHCSHFCMSYSSFSDPWWILNSFPLKDELRVCTLQHLPGLLQVTRLFHVYTIQSNSEDTTLHLDQLQQCFAIIEARVCTLQFPLPPQLDKHLVALGEVGHCISEGSHQQIPFSLVQQLMGTIHAIIQQNKSVGIHLQSCFNNISFRSVI